MHNKKTNLGVTNNNIPSSVATTTAATAATEPVQQIQKEAYCVKCKSRRNLKNTEKITMKNGKTAMKGTCTVCEKPVFKLAKKDEVI